MSATCRQLDSHTSTRTHTRAHTNIHSCHTLRKHAREPALAQHFARNTSDLQLMCWLLEPCPPHPQECCCSFPCTQPSSRKAEKIIKGLSSATLVLQASSTQRSVRLKQSARQIVLVRSGTAEGRTQPGSHHTKGEASNCSAIGCSEGGLSSMS